jgi:hypothetical protein
MGLNPQSEAPDSPSAAVEQWSEPAPTEARLEDGLRTNAQKHAMARRVGSFGDGFERGREERGNVPRFDAQRSNAERRIAA